MTPAPGSGTRCLLAFLATVGNNPVKPIMRLAYGIAIALCLSFPVVGMAWQQDAAGAATSAGQAPTAPAAGQTAPAEEPPAEGKKPSANPASASAAPRHPKRKVPAPAPDGAPHKVVVREGGASEPTAQIIPGMTPREGALVGGGLGEALGVVLYFLPARFCATTSPRGVGKSTTDTSPSCSSFSAASRTIFKCELASCIRMRP